MRRTWIFVINFELEGELNKSLYSYFLTGRQHLTNKVFDVISRIEDELTNVSGWTLCKISVREVLGLWPMGPH